MQDDAIVEAASHAAMLDRFNDGAPLPGRLHSKVAVT